MSTTEDYWRIVRRATEDPDLHERLVADPAGTWSEVTGAAVPDDIELVVLENGPKTVHIVLPDPSLSAEDLDAGAHSGGRDMHPGLCACDGSVTPEDMKKLGLHW